MEKVEKLEIVGAGKVERRQIEMSFDDSRLITRDDKHKFTENSNVTKTEAELDNLRKAEKIVLA